LVVAADINLLKKLRYVHILSEEAWSGCSHCPKVAAILSEEA